MSVCDDEKWGDTDEFGDRIFCPCALTYGGAGTRVCGCGLGLWHEWIEAWGENWPPDSCPHAAALRAVVEKPELVLAAVPEGTVYLDINNACLSIDVANVDDELYAAEEKWRIQYEHGRHKYEHL